MKRWIWFLACLLTLPSVSHAGMFIFDGWINYNTDKVFVNFNLVQDATDVRLWTDSFMNGQNFDPITALWKADGTLLAQNDDDSTIGPGQTDWDSGLALPTLAAGSYKFSIQVFNNLAIGPKLSNGFAYDGTVPVPIQEWWTGGAGYWRMNLKNVDSASPVPEPATVGLLGIGLASAGLIPLLRRRERRG